MIYEPDKDMAFYNAVRELKSILKQEGHKYRQMLFNDIYVIVSVDSNPDDIATIYDLKHKLRRLKNL